MAKTIRLLFIFIIAMNVSTCSLDIGVQENVPAVWKGQLVHHHSNQALKIFIYPVGQTYYFEGGPSSFDLGGRSRFAPELGPDEVYTDQAIYIPIGSLVTRMLGNGQLYGASIWNRTGNDPSAALRTQNVGQGAGRAILILAEEVLILDPGGFAFSVIETIPEDPEGFNLTVRKNLGLLDPAERGNHQIQDVTTRVRLGPPVDYNIMPFAEGGTWYVNIWGLGEWLPCHIHVEFHAGEPSQVTGRPAESINFAYVTMLATHEPIAPNALPSPDGITMSNINNQSRNWYKTERALQIADSIVGYQRLSGGWHKNTDMVNNSDWLAVNVEAGETIDYYQNNYSTIDNDATHVQLQYLGKIITMGANNPRYLDSFYRGLAFILRAQYPSGGWPQFSDPLRAGYYSEITYNDEAMSETMELLEDIYQGEWQFAFLQNNPAIMTAVARARAMGIECVLRSQWRTPGYNGLYADELTGWSQQVSPTTLQPSQGRAYELPSVGALESYDVVAYLMRIPNPGPRVIHAINSAVAWYQRIAMIGFTTERLFDQKYLHGSIRAILETGNPRDRLWNRFYDLETAAEGLYVARDGLIRWNYYDMPIATIGGYMMVGNRPQNLFEEYDAWRIRPNDTSYPLDNGLPDLTWDGMPANMEIMRCAINPLTSRR